MHAHKRFTVATNVQVSFCDPRSPWQRGSNENTNGLLRQYFPRGTDFSRISQSYLNAIALRLNQRPRKSWASKRRPIDYKWCCTDRLNAHPQSRHSLAQQYLSRRAKKVAVSRCSKNSLSKVAYSITSSAIASSPEGIASASILAVLRLMTKSNFVGCMTGKSPGLAPRRIRPT